MGNLNLSENALRVLEARYLAKNERGELIETPEELFRRVATNLAGAERAFGAGEARVQEVAGAFHDLMTRLDFLPNSPTLMNAGRPLQQLAACYVLPVPDSLEGIFDALKAQALVHQSGGGTGFAFSRLRPEGSIVGSTAGVASGPVSFMRIFDAATEQIKQGGARRGANMAILRVDHPDIERFITAKADMTSLTNFNISVGVTEAFLEAVREDREYDLVDPRTGEAVRRERARRIFDLMVEQAWRNGDPGMVFLDRMNTTRSNPTPEYGPIESSNPCCTGDTLVATPDGWRRADEIRPGDAIGTVLGTGTVARVEVYARRPVYRVRLSDGAELRVTAAHQFHAIKREGRAKHRATKRFTPLRLDELAVGDDVRIVPAPMPDRPVPDLPAGWTDRDYGLLLGILLGDGCITPKTLARRTVAVGVDAADAQWVALVEGLLRRFGPVGTNGTGRSRNLVAAGESGAAAAVLASRLEPGYAHEKRIPLPYLQTNERFLAGLLDGLFSTDGNVNLAGHHPVLRLKTASRGLAQDVRRALLCFGIHGRVVEVRAKPGRSDGRRVVPRHPQYEVLVSGAGLRTFAERIGLSRARKQQRLREALLRFALTGNTWLARITAIEPDGEETVYDLYEPESDTWSTEGAVSRGCGEQPLYPNDACTLGSINLARFVRTGPDGRPDVDWARLAEVIPWCVRLLDNVVEVNRYPLPEIERVSKAIRRIGLGVMGWADLLYQLGLPYDSEEALALAERLMRFVQEHADQASEALAAERGVFPAWERSIYGPEGQHEPHAQGVRRLRNATRTTIAPTGTLSIIADCSGGIEPVFALAFTRQHYLDRSDPTKPVRLREVNRTFEAELRRLLPDGRAEAVLDAVAAGEPLRAAAARLGAELPEAFLRVFVTAHEIHPNWHVRMQAAFQRYVDNAVSKCVVGDTLVLTADGILPIEALAPERGRDVFRPLHAVVAGEDGPTVATEFYSGGVRETRRVTTAQGSSIEGTPNHRIRVEAPDGAVVWKELGRIEPGDRVVIRYGQQLYPERDLVSPELARLLGHLVADGAITDNGVTLYHRDPDVNGDRARLLALPEVTAVIERLRNTRNTPRAVWVREDRRRPGLMVVGRNGRAFVRYLEGELGMRRRAANTRAPDVVLRSSWTVQREFLRGLFTDCGVAQRDRANLTFNTASKLLARQVRAMLLNAGIYATLHEHQVGARTYYRVYLPVREALAFAERVGFVEPARTEQFARWRRLMAGTGAVAVRGRARDGWHRGGTLLAERSGYRVEEVREVRAGAAPVFDVAVPDGRHAFITEGIVSHNTINLPREATVADVRRAYELAAELGCKGITVYRDGSRELQVLSHAREDREDGTVPAGAGTNGAAPGPVRRRLPDVRQAVTHKFTVGEHEGYLTVGLYEDGSPGEIFVKISKEGSTVSGLMDAVALLTSMALQYGVPLGDMARKFAGTRFEPSGFTGNPELPQATSLLDYVFRWLERKFGPVGDPAAARRPVQLRLPDGNGAGPEKPGEVSGTGCPECGMLLHFAEGCLICRGCGYTKCG